MRPVTHSEPLLPGDLALHDGQCHALIGPTRHVRDESWHDMPVSQVLADRTGAWLLRWPFSDTGGPAWRP